MSYSFCFGPSGSGKSRWLRRHMIAEAQASMAGGVKDRTHYIVLVPEQYTMQTQRELVEEHPSRVLMNIDVLSFGRLAYRVFEETGADQRKVLDDIGKSLLLRRVASRCADELQVLRRGIHRPGMIDEIKSILSEFMQYGIGAGQIREMADYARDKGQIALQTRLCDLEQLYTAFRREEAERYITSEETLDLLASAIPRAESLQDSVIVFDGFTGFTTVQYRVVLALIRCAREVIFSFTSSPDQGPDIRVTASGGPAGPAENLFYLSRRTVYDIRKMAEKEGLARGQDIYLPDTETPPRFARSRVLAHLERQLFRFPEIPFAEKREGETGESLQLLAASTPQEEVRQIFARIQDRIAATGAAYRDFAIVTADLETYGDLFAREAQRSGIPVYVDRTTSAFHNILIEGIRSVLQISAENFSYASVFRYLRSGLSCLSPEETDRLENYCLANGIRGRKKWSAPFDASCEEARVRFLREVEPVLGLQAISLSETDHLSAAGHVLAADGGAPAEGGRSRRARTAAKRTEELYAFLTGCGAQARMDLLADSFAAAGDVILEKQYRQIYRAVIDLLDQIYDLTGQEKMSARDYLELLESGLSQIRLGTIPQRVDRILVGDIERTRLTQVQHLFFAGVNEGNIPRSVSRGGILSDMDREFLERGPAVLAPTPRQQMFTQRLYLYLNMTKPSATLTVSFARTSREGRSLRPSYLIGMLQTLFPALRARVPEEAPVRDRICSARDGLRLLADGLRGFTEGNIQSSPEQMEDFTLLYGFYTSTEVRADPAVQTAVEGLRRAALMQYRPELLGEEMARAVYGSRLTGGISRLETAARCMLMQHLRYGLHLRERDLYELSNADGGTILHAALQRFDALLQEQGLTWRTFTEEDAVRLADRALREEAVSYRNLLLFKSARDESGLDRYGRRLLRTVDTLQYQILQGDFEPTASELSFGGADASLPAIRFSLGGGRTLDLIGRIDRVDQCLEEAGAGAVGPGMYYRIMDFKSGRNDLREKDIRRGLQLQLILYMYVMLQSAEVQPLPAAMLYYRMDDPLVEMPASEILPAGSSSVGGAGSADVMQQIRRNLRPTGLVCDIRNSVAHLDRHLDGTSDVIPVRSKKGGGYASGSRILSPEQFRELSDAAVEAACSLARRILDGETEASPAVLEKETTACRYCPYRDACGFDPRIPGYGVRRN